MLVCVCVCIDCTRKWIGNAVQRFSSSSVRSRDKIARVRRVPLPAGLLPVLLWSCPSLQRCCWKMILLSLHPNIIVHVENVVSLFSSPSTSSQKVRKCGSHKFLDRILVNFAYPSLQRCCWKMMLFSLHPNITVHVENVVSLFSSLSTSSQKVRKCGGHHCLTEYLWPLLLRSCPSLQRCCWNMMLLSLHPNITVHVENVVSLFSSLSTSSQKVRKCGGHHCLTEYLWPLSCPSLQRCCWNMMLLSLHPNII